MPPLPLPVLLALVVTLLGAATGATVMVLRLHKRIRRMEDTPPSTIAGLKPGLVELSGTLHPVAELQHAPVTARACIWWRFTVAEKRTSGGMNNGTPNVQTRWVAVVDDRAFVPCRLQDGTGSVEMDLSGADMVLRNTVHAFTGPMEDAPPEVESLLQDRYGKTTRGWWWSKTLRLSETVLPPATQVYVLGHAVEGPGGVLRIARGGDSLLISDRSEADLLRTYRWQRAGAVATVTASAIAALVLIVGPILGW